MSAGRAPFVCARCGPCDDAARCIQHRSCSYQLYLTDKLPLDALQPAYDHTPGCERDFDKHCTCGADPVSYARRNV